MRQFLYGAGWIGLIVLLFWLDLRGGSSVLDLWYDLVCTLLVVLLLWPAPQAPDMFASKKASPVARLLAPARAVYGRFAPKDAVLLRATRRWLFAALIAAWALKLLRSQSPAFAHFPLWWLIECGVVGLLIARALSFWIADRRPKSPEQQASA